MNLNLRTSASIALLSLASFGIASSARAATTHTINIVGSSFSPSSITVTAGDSVRWVQQDGIAHTSTSGTPPGTPDGLWDSGFLSLGQTFTQPFPTAGSFPFYCQPHFFFMSGTVTVQGGANQAPTVSITSPTNGAAVPITGGITIEATATDDGSVAQVQFFDGSTSLGTDTGSPYSVAADLSLGGHILTAVATDNSGLSATSAPVSITVRTVPITNPIVEKIPKGDITIEIQTVADGMASPLGMAVPDDGSGRMFVYDQSGLIWIVRPGTGRSSVPLLDIRSRLVLLAAYDERGLLGCVAHPNFAQNPLIYTYSSESNSGPADFASVLPAGVTNNHQSVVAEWRIDTANSNRVDVFSRREVLRIDEPQANHNGGTMRFGPDGLLYIALGDGGQADDQGDGHSVGGNAQDTTNILGSVIRIDVDGTNSANGHYGVPANNPFVGGPGVDEIYAYGFRNPFSFSFDRTSGQLYLGDVGQNVLEEVDIVTKGGNFGWRIKEGNLFFDPNGNGAGYVTDIPVVPVPPGLIDPIAVYDHDEGLAVVGGYVYRGSAVPALQGRYLMADWGTFAGPSGRLFYLDASNNVKELRLGLDDRLFGLWVKGWGEDASGELYVFASRVLGPAGNTGKMLKIIAPPDPLAFTGAQPNNTNMAATWTGGLGPFALQNKPGITDTIWANQKFSTTRNTLAAMDNLAGFFRASDAAHVGSIPLTAWLSGLMERPTMLTNSGSGSGTFILDDDTLYFNIRYQGLSGTAIAAHIHGPSTAAGSAGVLINLSPFNGGGFGSNGMVSGSVVLTPALKAMVLGGQTYVNFHTAQNSDGEIRGQIAPVLMQASLNGPNERPTPLNVGGHGIGTFALVGNQLSLNVTYRDLTGTATASHIHGSATANQSAGVLVNLAPFNGGAFGASGSLEGTATLTASQLALVVDGLTYVNVHTVLNSGGEIRGQLLPQSTAVPLTAWMSGLMERPTPLTNNASGAGIFSLEGTTLTFSIKYKDLSGTATAAHIHGPAAASAPAGVLINLAPYNGGSFGSSGTLAGRIQVTPAQRDMILSGLTYANVHTVANSGGEIRGQIAPVGMMASLSGVNERPVSIQTAGFGTATLAVVGNQVTFNVAYSGLTGTATASHFHGPAGALAAAGVIVNLAPFNGGAFGVSGSLSGTATFTDTQLAALVDGLTYLNVHTVLNSGGEIRGQVTH
jgi:glucose/arabinose dehydrogenase/plastocyanin